jgi:hypothetical protein
MASIFHEFLFVSVCIVVVLFVRNFSTRSSSVGNGHWPNPAFYIHSLPHFLPTFRPFVVASGAAHNGTNMARSFGAYPYTLKGKIYFYMQNNEQNA